MASNHPFSIGLLNPKNPTNVASVLRAAGCYQASSVFYTGQRYGYAKAFNADTQGMHKVIPNVGVPDLQQVKPKGAKAVIVELVEGAQPLPHYQHPDNAFYIFGPEDGSVSDDVLAWADDVVYIPTKGCMNLAATVNVVLYDRLAKSDFEASDEKIRASRDKNNRTRVLHKPHD
ncbi:RNA methyltransferase [Alteromonas sp. C1M14]|uniref:RNA methyltransferase n=1 Tax=Alteromonas sp. C1M14 TaxID=2841567 RepID=UPI001C0895A4|nr:RNA methyltransferase [Alteromonas sp. C1M14]MBU2976960.1 RNA methyltransferase [Alteromonas sp. C1M14]